MRIGVGGYGACTPNAVAVRWGDLDVDAAL